MQIQEKKYHLNEYDRNGQIMIDRDKELKFSVIVPVENPDISPLFISTNKNYELILVGPSKFQNEGAEYLYENIECHPMAGGFVHSLNMAISKSTHDWILVLDSILEFKDDFFTKLDEDIRVFSDTFQSFKFMLLGQTLRQRYNHQKWNNYIGGQQTRFQFINSPNIDSKFFCIHKDFFRELNGFDERYDLGSGYYFNNILFRVMYYPSTQMASSMLDNFLMAYLKTEHDTESFIKTNSLLWEYDKIEIMNGKLRAFNKNNL